MVELAAGGSDDTVDGAALGAEGVKVDESGCIDGVADGSTVGVAVVAANPVGFKHRPES